MKKLKKILKNVFKKIMNKFEKFVEKECVGNTESQEVLLTISEIFKKIKWISISDSSDENSCEIHFNGSNKKMFKPVAFKLTNKDGSVATFEDQSKEIQKKIAEFFGYRDN